MLGSLISRQFVRRLIHMQRRSFRDPLTSSPNHYNLLLLLQTKLRTIFLQSLLGDAPKLLAGELIDIFHVSQCNAYLFSCVAWFLNLTDVCEVPKCHLNMKPHLKCKAQVRYEC